MMIWKQTVFIAFCVFLLHEYVTSYHLHPVTTFASFFSNPIRDRQHQKVVHKDRTLTRVNCIDRDFVPIEPPIYQQSDWWMSKINPNVTRVYQKWPFAKPDLITFDVVGTLIQPSQSIGKWLRACLHEGSGYQNRLPQPQLFRKHFNETHRQMREKYPCFGKHHGMTSREWWYKCVYDSYRSTPKLDEIEDNFDQIVQTTFPILHDEVFGSGEGWIVKEQVEYTLRKLKEWRDQGKGPKLGILANFDERVHKILKDLDLYKYFDFVISSGEVGYEAPQKELFDLALQKVKLPPNASAYHMGDKITRDVYGAIRANWKAFHYYENYEESFDDWRVYYTAENVTVGQQRAKENLYFGRKDISFSDVNMEWTEIWGIEEVLTLFGFPDDPNLQYKTTVLRGVYEDEDL